MRSGKAPRPRNAGFAYLCVLLLVMAIGIGAMKAASLWRVTRKREQEAELLFVGDQFRDAIAHYYQSGQGSRYPDSFDALLKDSRVSYTLRHLRRLYLDPMTGKDDWGIVKSPDGGIMGVYSPASGKPLKQGGFDADHQGFADKNSYKDWQFIYLPPDAEQTPGPGPNPNPNSSRQ
jgi:type II secretory pathway pseudopilin PulG